MARRRRYRDGWRWPLAWPLSRRIWWSSGDRRVHSSVPFMRSATRRRFRAGAVLARQLTVYGWLTLTVWWAPTRYGWYPRLVIDRAATIRCGLLLAAALAGVVLVWVGPGVGGAVRRLTGGDQWLVERATDGDTLVCRRRGGQVKVRVRGVDAWEKSEPYGPEATTEAARLAGRTVRLVDRDPGGDKYGRDVAYVEYGGQDWGLRLITLGLARAQDYGRDHPRGGRYAKAQQRAERERVGAWSAVTRSPAA